MSAPESPRNCRQSKGFPITRKQPNPSFILPGAVFQARANHMIWWNILYWTMIILKDGHAYYSPIIDGETLAHLYGDTVFLYDELYAVYNIGDQYEYIPIKLASPGEMLHPIHTIGEFPFL